MRFRFIKYHTRMMTQNVCDCIGGAVERRCYVRGEGHSCNERERREAAGAAVTGGDGSPSAGCVFLSDCRRRWGGVTCDSVLID